MLYWKLRIMELLGVKPVEFDKMARGEQVLLLAYAGDPARGGA